MALALLVAAGTVTAWGQVVSIAFQLNGSDPPATGNDGGTAFFPGQVGDWNIMDAGAAAPSGSPSTAGLGTPLLDGSGNPSSLNFELNTNPVGTYAFYDTGNADNLCRNIIYLVPSSTSTNIGWQISGLTPKASYNLAFYGQSEVVAGVVSFDNPGVWTIGNQSLTNLAGTNMLAGVVFGNADGIQGPGSVLADGSGTISGTFSFYAGPGGTYTGTTHYSGWSGLQVMPAGKGVPPFANAPTISPTSTTYAGSSVTLTANTGGAPPLNYQWQLDVGAGPKNIPGATNASYTFVAITADQGNFDLVVTDILGAATSAVVALTVNPASAPILGVDTTPAAALDPVGDLVTFTAVYRGDTPHRLPVAV